MEDILPFLIFLIVGLFQLLGGNKKKKRRPTPPQPTTGQPQKPSSGGGDFFQEFMKQLEELENPKPQPKADPFPMPEPVTMEVIPPPAQSSEITQAEYSNLEEGILDATHKSKFAHHALPAYKKKKKLKPITLFKNVDAREAFVYSLIFDRKEY